MTSSKSTTRALISSALAILMCVAMLIGTTFAWFTDTASTGVNKIVSGNLKVDIIGADSDSHIEKLNFTKAATTDAEAGAEILWEPGCRYLTEGFRIANKGNLALKWKAEINKDNIVNGKVVNTAKDGVSLLDVIDFYVVTKAADGTETAVAIENFTGKLAANVGKSETYYIKGVMQTTAGNDYQDLTLDGITITVYATQDTVESDSFNDQYDKDATYPVTTVTRTDELTEALMSKKTIVLGNDITITADTSTANNLKQTLDFNGHKLILDGEDEFNYGYLDVYGELTLVDSVGDGGIIGKFYDNSTKDPTAVFINNGAVVNLESGTIENVYRGVANTFSGGTFNMTGGKIAVKQASAIESAGVLFHRGGTVNLNGGEISGAIYFEKTATSQPSYTIGAGFTNTNNSVFNTSGVTATQNEDGIWIATIV